MRKVCDHCKKKRECNRYIIADDLERPRTLCHPCVEELFIKVMLRLHEDEVKNLKGDR